MSVQTSWRWSWFLHADKYQSDLDIVGWTYLPGDTMIIDKHD